MPSHPHRRKQYLVNRKLQLRYALYTFGTLLIVSIVAACFLSLGIWNIVVKEFSEESMHQRLLIASRIADYEKARESSQNETLPRLANYKDSALLSIREKEILGEVIRDNNKELFVRILILFFFIALGTIFLTHKIAGPLYRLQQVFKQIRNGNLKGRIHFRKGDQPQELLPELNSMIGSLDYSITKLKTLTTALIAAYESHDSSNETKEKLKFEIEQEFKRYQTSHAYTIQE